MQAPMNEYYTDEEYQYALKQMYRIKVKFARVLKQRFRICYSSMMKFNKVVQNKWNKVRLLFLSFL